jgi:hypothetical protein
MRKRQTNTGLPLAIIIGAAVAVVLLFAVFSLLPYEAMTARWPLGIASEEVAAYQRWFDQRPGQTSTGEAERMDLDSLNTNNGGIGSTPVTVDFHTKDYAAAVQVSEQGGTWAVRFPDEKPFRSQLAIRLIPASMASIEVKYAQLLAESFGCTTPSTDFVRVFLGNKDQGLYMKVEEVTPALVRKKGLVDAVMLTRSPQDGRLARMGQVSEQEMSAAEWALARARAGEAGRMDTVANAMIAWYRAAGIMDPGTRDVLAFDPLKGRLYPIVGAAQVAVDPAGRAASVDVRTRRQVMELAARMKADSVLWNSKFAVVEQMWAPVLSDGRSAGFLQAHLAEQRQRWIARLLRPQLVVEDTPAASTTLPDPVLEPWLKRMVGSDDTLRFPRGKHSIDHTIVLPASVPVVFEKGARFTISPGASFVVNNALMIKGTGLNPVFVRPADDNAPYGTICVNGTGNTRCSVRGMRMSGGDQTWVDGRLHRGMLSFRGCEVDMANCEFGSSAGPFAVDVEGGSLSMTSCAFVLPRSGALSVQNGKAEVISCRFVGSTEAGMGGTVGVEVRAARLLLRDCDIMGMGEAGCRASSLAQVLVMGSRFTGNRIALDVSDLAVVHAYRLRIVGQEVAYHVHRSSSVLSGGHLTVHVNELENNLRERDLDEFSTLVVTERPDPALIQQFGVVP